MTYSGISEPRLWQHLNQIIGRKSTLPPTPEICSVCGEDVPRGALACPECGAEQVRRQLTAPSFRLAGAGWYETDFKKDGDSKRNLADKGDAAAKPEVKADVKPEAKPEPKSEPKPESKPEPKPAAGSATGSGSTQ